MADSRTQYATWDREAAAQRALAQADTCGACGVDDTIWNFAFGSNLNAQRVRSRNMTPAQSVRGYLPGWSLVFNHRGGYGNIESREFIRAAGCSDFDLSRLPQPIPEETHGVLLRLTRRDFAELARQEYGYDVVAVDVICYPGDAAAPALPGGAADGVFQPASVLQRALAFKSATCAVTSSRTLPSSRYLALIQEGARDLHLEASYLQWLDSIKSDP